MRQQELRDLHPVRSDVQSMRRQFLCSVLQPVRRQFLCSVQSPLRQQLRPILWQFLQRAVVRGGGVTHIAAYTDRRH